MYNDLLSMSCESIFTNVMLIGIIIIIFYKVTK